MNRRITFTLLLTAAACAGGSLRAAAEWSPAKAPIMTPWAKDVSPDKALPEYPRPQMVRKHWTNLNGLWDYAITDLDSGVPQKWDGRILVPFAIESALSGVGKNVGPEKALWYHRAFAKPELEKGGRLLLHFGAVDWLTQVYVNGKLLGQHRGGYDPFSFDVTEALTDAKEQSLVLRVWDPTDAGSQPRGKQVINPGGIFYTSVTGIWQTVWLEPVPTAHIRSLKITPQVDDSAVDIVVNAPAGQPVQIDVLDGGKLIAKGEGISGKPVQVKVPEAKLWSPDSPHLYDLVVRLGKTDEVKSYFGQRKIEMRKDEAGIPRMYLNNKVLFQMGPLDQGWWPDGLYTAPTDAALKFDVEMMRKMGFNMARKHVKAEPARWYYWADKLGLMVWQDMPSMMVRGERHNVRPGLPHDANLTAQESLDYHTELKALIDANVNAPSIVVWVPFNEGWGQHDTNAVLQWTKKYDPTRLVDGPSGWEDRGGGDLKDMHNYPGPGMFPVMKDRVSVLGEFGGLGLQVPNHLWQLDKNWGYRSFKTKEELAENYRQLVAKLKPLIARGLAAAVYTQITDVEVEVNGLLTYDRQLKVDPAELAKWHAELYLPPPKVSALVPTGEQSGKVWSYTTERPADGWEKPGFAADAKWKQGESGFGTKETRNTVVRTVWNTPEIWLRREVTLDKPVDADKLALSIYHDEDAEVYFNGVLAAKLSGYLFDYTVTPVTAEGAKALRAGRNTIAIHCRQSGGGQYIDVGLLSLEKAEPAKP
ncbi:MAG: beta-galactosidase [Planctomycetes bacterium]|nr:beta-galactosidase [Planctomycetota bacterium]